MERLASCSRGSQRIYFAGAESEQELRLELVWDNHVRPWEDLLGVDFSQALGHIEFPIVAHNRVADVHDGLFGASRTLHLVQQFEHCPKKRGGANVPCEQVSVATLSAAVCVTKDAVSLQALRQIRQCRPVQLLPLDKGVPSVVAKLHRVHHVNLEAQELQGKGRGAVTNVTVAHVRLDAEHLWQPRLCTVRRERSRMHCAAWRRRRHSCALRLAGQCGTLPCAQTAEPASGNTGSATKERWGP
mmetsp:Transcript_88116/g.247820  ORF Transcript_88116/g.247820 Transcript_88116/m.247820 type:complete len:244 (-) Transcript_88116:32-763(-)